MRLNHGTDNIPWPQRPPRGVQYNVNADSIDSISEQRAGGQSDREADEGQEGQGNAAGEDTGGDEIVNWASAEDTKGVSLLRHLHSCELGGERGADAPGEDDGGDDGGELAGEGEGEDPADGAVEPHAGELAHELDGEGHADEGGGEEADPEGPGPHPLELGEGVGGVDPAGEDAVEDLARQDQDGEAAVEGPGRGPPGEERGRVGVGVGHGGVVGVDGDGIGAVLVGLGSDSSSGDGGGGFDGRKGYSLEMGMGSMEGFEGGDGEVVTEEEGSGGFHFGKFFVGSVEAHVSLCLLPSDRPGGLLGV